MSDIPLFPTPPKRTRHGRRLRGCVRYLYELPKVVFNHKANYLDRRLEELRGVLDQNDKIDLEVYEAEMERRRQRGLQLEAETARFRAKIRERGYDRSM